MAAPRRLLLVHRGKDHCHPVRAQFLGLRGEWRRIDLQFFQKPYISDRDSVLADASDKAFTERRNEFIRICECKTTCGGLDHDHCRQGVFARPFKARRQAQQFAGVYSGCVASE
jgi:hypothetical protein